MQAKNGILVTLLILVLIASVVSPFYIAKTIRDNKVVIPEYTAPIIPDVNNEKLDKLCELTDGCEYFEGSESELIALNTSEAEDDFEEALADLLGLDEDDFTIEDIDYKDGQVRAYSEDDKDDDSWTCKVFIRVTIQDEDTPDEEVIYIVVTSVLDEGEYDDLTIEEVTRRFEF